MLHIGNVLARIRKHLPYVDRRELSRGCRNFREEPLPIYMNLGLEILGFDPEVFRDMTRDSYIAEDFVLWISTELTEAGLFQWVPHRIELFTCCDLSNTSMGMRIIPRFTKYIICENVYVNSTHGELRHRLCTLNPMSYIDNFASTNLHKIVYHRDRLLVKNWNVLLTRRATILPDLTYKGSYFDREDSTDLMNEVNSLITYYARRGYTLTININAGILLETFKNLVELTIQKQKNCMCECKTSRYISSSCFADVVWSIVLGIKYNTSVYLEQ